MPVTKCQPTLYSFVSVEEQDLERVSLANENRQPAAAPPTAEVIIGENVRNVDFNSN